ncbi:Fip1 motif family protein [Trichomonas vaginalis G3]|uniref:Fip1 motif family protein n=1 Tax=Trichomonas vaginalis (strain ATCC PRA-98 / G3) TaxID=412133 RepID=A2E247_TRIV3|nr:Fip1 motif family [Trichomonas vaginalis G3]EAY13261.1 Fip1 motif family protein [Trichomonas vaginalis G3]KAI5494080.1 Fip1 motif family [Trichomonas vaginalis G3]|eukprot:XP_001325484.1 Fip1 motif family protein [Trichomonas vaginalis G3]
MSSEQEAEKLTDEEKPKDENPIDENSKEEGNDEYDSDEYGSEEEESSESESDDIELDQDLNVQAQMSAIAYSTRALIQPGPLNNYEAWITQSDIVTQGSKNPWEIINPSGVHPRNNKKSIFYYDLSALPNDVESKPWTAPGADITDWFNYGFTEETWEEYRKTMLNRIKNIEYEQEIKSLTGDTRQQVKRN